MPETVTRLPPGFATTFRPGAAVQFQDQTEETAMIAVQGPGSLPTASQAVDADLESLDYYTGRVCQVGGQRGIASRTGYTGEEGYELIAPAAVATDVWNQLLGAGQTAPVPVGLGARDTLRLEAAMPLYGHELSESVDPYRAGLGFAVQLRDRESRDREFIGSDALKKLKDKPAEAQRIGLEMAGRRVPREGYPVLSGGEQVGEITSGTFSPTLERPIAMAYVRPELATLDGELDIEIRGKTEPAKVVKLPFYNR